MNREIAIAGVAVVLLLGCNQEKAEQGPPKPTDDEARQAVAAYLNSTKVRFNEAKNSAEKAWANAKYSDSSCGVLGGDLLSAEVGEIRWGIHQTNPAPYWPAMVDLTGKCAEVVPTCGDDRNQACPPVPTEFRLTGLKFRFQQDDFGKWIVQPL